MGLIDPKLQATAAALVVKAVRDLMPGSKFAELHCTNLGFRCDFIFQKRLDAGFLHQLQERCRSLLTSGLAVKGYTMIPENASELLLHHGETIQSKIANESRKQFVDVLQIEETFVLCQSPYTPQLEGIQAIFLFEELEELPVPLKHRFGMAIRGAAFSSSRDLKTFQKKYEKYKTSNHTVQGQERKQLVFREEINSDVSCWLAEGTAEIQAVWNMIGEELAESGYETVITPTLIREIDSLKNCLDPIFLKEEPFVLRPSMAPAHIAIGMERFYKSQKQVKLSEFGKIYQNIPVEELYGSVNSTEHLMDSQTIFCSRENALHEIISSLQSILKIITMSDIPFRWVLSTQNLKDKPGKRKSLDVNEWDKAVSLLREGLERAGCEFEADISQDLWGPRIEMRFKDCIEREWPGSFIEINLTLPRLAQNKFGKGSMSEIPVVIHRSLAGPVDRFVSLKMEN